LLMSNPPSLPGSSWTATKSLGGSSFRSYLRDQRHF